MTIEEGRPVQIAICEALGLDSDKTRYIKIEFVPDDIVLVEVVSSLQRDEFDKLVEVLTKYRIKVSPENMTEDVEFIEKEK